MAGRTDSVLEALARLAAAPMRDGDDVYQAVLEPGLDDDAIDAIAARIDAPLGRYGDRTRMRRHGEHRLFGCAPAERRPGLLSRLFGR